jgi:hypothetical protein
MYKEITEGTKSCFLIIHIKRKKQSVLKNTYELLQLKNISLAEGYILDLQSPKYYKIPLVCIMWNYLYHRSKTFWNKTLHLTNLAFR